MGYKTASPDQYGLLKAYARENRRNATPAESVLWEHLREGVSGVKFLRQHVIGDYIADFVSRHGGLIEVFTNEEVLYDTDNTIKQIEHYFNES